MSWRHVKKGGDLLAGLKVRTQQAIYSERFSLFARSLVLKAFICRRRQSVFLSRNTSRGFEGRRFNLKENGTRHVSLSSLLGHCHAGIDRLTLV